MNRTREIWDAVREEASGSPVNEEGRILLVGKAVEGMTSRLCKKKNKINLGLRWYGCNIPDCSSPLV